MELPREKTADAARHAKRRLENLPLEAQQAQKVVVEVERQRTIQQTTDGKCERARVDAERRSV